MADELPPQIARELHQQNEQLTKVNLRLDRVLKLLDGDPTEDITGIRPRLVLVEQRMKLIPEDLAEQVRQLRVELDAERDRRTNLEQRWIGIKWFMGGLGVTSVLSALTIARLLFGGP